MRILVVDDSYMNRTQAKALLKEYGDCDAAPNGTLALQLFEAAHQEGCPYELITMDVEMPDLSGQEVVRRIRAWEEAHEVYAASGEVKILMISAKEDTDNVVDSFRGGCEGYLIKPLTAKRLGEALAKIEVEVS